MLIKIEKKKEREREDVTEIYHEENQLEGKWNQKNDQCFQLFQEMFLPLLLSLRNQLGNKLLEVLLVHNHLFEKKKTVNFFFFLKERGKKWKVIQVGVGRAVVVGVVVGVVVVVVVVVVGVGGAVVVGRTVVDVRIAVVVVVGIAVLVVEVGRTVEVMIVVVVVVVVEIAVVVVD